MFVKRKPVLKDWKRKQIRVGRESEFGPSQSMGKNIYKTLKELIKVLKEVAEIEVLLL